MLRSAGWILIVLVAAGLIGSACADTIPTTSNQQVRTANDASNSSCMWMPWNAEDNPIGRWFALHPQDTGLHWWYGRSREVRSATEADLSRIRHQPIGDGTIVWREQQGEETHRFTDPGRLVQLKPGINLIPWIGDERHEISLRETFRWIVPQLVSIWHWDESEQRCRAMVIESTKEFMNTRKHLDELIGKDDLIALELNEAATWTQSWIQHPVIVTIGQIPPDEYAELHAELASVTGFIAARYGLESDEYSLALLDRRSTYQRVSGQAVPGLADWACGFGSQSGMVLLVGCDDPIAFDHEYVHVVQEQTVGRALDRPIWFIEGMAEYLAARYRDAHEYKPYREARADAVDRAQGTTGLVIPLSDLEHLGEWSAVDEFSRAYAASWLAVEWLVAHHGEQSLFDFLEELKKHSFNASWRSAFVAVFGSSVADFYDAYDEHALQFDYPLPHQIRGKVTAPDGTPAEGLRIYAFPLEGGSSLNGQVDADGHFKIDLGSGSYRLSVLSESRCTDYGAYGERGRLVSRRHAKRVWVGTAEAEQVHIQLPNAVSELRGWSICNEPKSDGWVRGTVYDENGAPLAGVVILACPLSSDEVCGRVESQADGAYVLNAPAAEMFITVGPPNVYCRQWGFRGVNGTMVFEPAAAEIVTLSDSRLQGVDVHLPVPIEELETTRSCW